MPTTYVVVIGLGYVGLPLAQGAVRAGRSVVGLDLDAAVAKRAALLFDTRGKVEDTSVARL